MKALDRIIDIGQNDTIEKLTPSELALYMAWIVNDYKKTDWLENAAADLAAKDAEIARLQKIEQAAKELVKCHYVDNDDFCWDDNIIVYFVRDPYGRDVALDKLMSLLDGDK